MDLTRGESKAKSYSIVSPELVKKTTKISFAKMVEAPGYLSY
jgi:hypothetical protein